MWVGGSGCERMRALASAAVDGELEDELRPLLRTHLDCCSSCRSWVAQVEAIIRYLRAPEQRPSGKLARSLASRA